MVERREPGSMVAFIDDYCQTYRNLFPDVRNFEAFKFLHLGVISEIQRKSLPAIARIIGLKDGQELHHFWRDTRQGCERIARNAVVVNQDVNWGQTNHTMYR